MTPLRRQAARPLFPFSPWPFIDIAVIMGQPIDQLVEQRDSSSSSAAVFLLFLLSTATLGFAAILRASHHRSPLYSLLIAILSFIAYLGLNTANSAFYMSSTSYAQSRYYLHVSSWSEACRLLAWVFVIATCLITLWDRADTAKTSNQCGQLRGTKFKLTRKRTLDIFLLALLITAVVAGSAFLDATATIRTSPDIVRNVRRIITYSDAASITYWIFVSIFGLTAIDTLSTAFFIRSRIFWAFAARDMPTDIIAFGILPVVALEVAWMVLFDSMFFTAISLTLVLLAWKQTYWVPPNNERDQLTHDHPDLVQMKWFALQQSTDTLVGSSAETKAVNKKLQRPCIGTPPAPLL
ncbi:hypothetical protein BKA62DRAFT_708090 [Auriculariales sp. MPI-PUGE-AT-0066]|nr:hypothetical protein BKA62DRAFT_708090 [Auriculariales sp. MPI-PUGE-AT-0066]